MKSETVPERHIGVDVSKTKLDIYVPAMGKDSCAPFGSCTCTRPSE